MTGVSIGCVTRSFKPFSSLARPILTISSVKMIGLFVTALVGVYTIEDLWEKFGDVKMSIVSVCCESLTLASGSNTFTA